MDAAAQRRRMHRNDFCCACRWRYRCCHY